MSNPPLAPPKEKRARAGSFQDRLEKLEHDPNHHLAGPFVPNTPTVPSLPPQDPTGKVKHAKPKQKVAFAVDENSKSAGLLEDLRTMRWMRVPASSAKILGLPIVMWINWHFLSTRPNPFSHLLMISNRLPDSPPDDPRYGKSYYDLLFIAYYVVVFSFIRQSLSLYILRPLAHYWGLRNPSKLDRFAEQGYAVIYFSIFASTGIYVMSQLPTWWYRTEYLWIDYPHWRMTPLIKIYYLLQTAYWLQQLMVLALRLEKPRKDFNELIIHHLVTIWLVGWSYLINLTYIGNAIFITMDFSDIFLAVAKCFNYLKMDTTANIAFAWFVCVWTYMRHYLNIMILWSVWTEIDLMKPETRQWNPAEGVWFIWWMKYQVFVPIFLLQLVNIFWYLLIWRILLRAIFAELADERSDDEDEGSDSQDRGRNIKED